MCENENIIGISAFASFLIEKNKRERERERGGRT